MVVVPAGSPTTAARLFAGTDVEAVWKYNRRTRAWDLGYRPAHDGGAGFPVEPGDILWVVAERDLVVDGKAAPEVREPRIADPAIEVSVSQGHSCALRESGVIVCWGANDRGQADAPPGRYRSVSAGWSHTCALRESGEIACWGSNREGESDAPPGKYLAVGAAYRIAARCGSPARCSVGALPAMTGSGCPQEAIARSALHLRKPARCRNRVRLSVGGEATAPHRRVRIDR